MRRNSGKRASSKGNGALSGISRNVTNRTVKKKKFQNTRLFKIIRIILLLIIILFIINFIRDFTDKVPKKVSLVIGDEKVKLKYDIEVDKENNIFMSIDDIKKLYDSNIYYSNNTLITTYNKHIAILEIGKTTMKINDVVQEIKGTLKEKDGVVYLPILDLKDVYDFDENYNKETKILSIDSKSKEKKESVVLKKSELKEDAKNFSKTLEKVNKTQYVTVFETKGDFTKIRTKSGNIGYIKTKKISKPELIWENMDEDKLENINVLNEYSIVESNYEVLQNVQQSNIVIPNLFNIAENEEDKIEVQDIIDLEGTKFMTYKDWANASNVTICPTVTLKCSMSKICSSYESRSFVINTLYNQLVNNKLNMICIDFIDIDDTEGLYRFVTEMLPRFKCAGMQVIVKYNNSLSKDRLNNIVDYVID